MGPFVERPRLLEAMERSGVGLVLLAGAPGSGKTVLLRQWLEQFTDKHRAWVAPDTEYGSPARFWKAALLGLGVADKPVAAAVRRALEQGADAEALLSPLVDHFDSGPESEAVIVLDDYQSVSSEPIHQQVAWLVEHAPPALRVVIATRHDPPLPIGRWRVRERLAEVSDADLRFDRSEVAAMFAGFSHRVVDALTERTEGWAAGLQLAAMASRRAADPAAFLETLDASETGISEFLVQEALDPQPPDLRDFLLSTAVLESFDAELSAAVAGRMDSAGVIARLLSRHVFVVPVDRHDGWFRYHRLFAEVLREEVRRLLPEHLQLASHRAAVWHAGRGEPRPAIEYALAAGDYTMALEQLTTHHFDFGAHAESPLVLDWLDRIPDRALAHDPIRALEYALVLAGTGRVAQAVAVAARVETQLGPHAPRALRSTVAIIRSAQAAVEGDHEAFEERAAEVEEMLSVSHPAAESWWMLRAWILGLAGRFRTSQASFSEAAKLGSLASESLGGLGAGFQAEVLAQQGSLREAAVKVRSALTTWEGSESVYHPAVAAALRAGAMVDLEAGRLDEAQRRLEQALAADEKVSLPIHRVLNSVLLAEVARARGRADEALERVLDAWRPRDNRPLGALLRTYLAEARVRAELDLGNPGDAARSAGDAALPAIAVLLRARIALAEGDRRTAYHHLVAAGHGIGSDWPRRQIEAHLLKARAYLDSNPNGARHHVTKALELGGPEGLLWTFAQETELAQLYSDVAGRRPVPGLGALVTQRVTGPRQVGSDLVEEPSERELQVLTLLARGLSYQEVANELFLSRNTVKAHAQSVYRKIGAHTLAEATERAHRMGLVGPTDPDVTPPG